MPKDYRAITADIDEYALKLKALVPEAMGAFGKLSRGAQAPGALDHRMKELVALAISVAMRCDGCIGYHARGAVRTGATRQEVAEVLAVAVQMGGGPAVDYAADALRAFDQWSPPEPSVLV
ncbi:MAG TPA: carboxymuconolactone decarboxylase family protein [Acetobacteraceae bacterium]|nr:carboxymuconolactone decarboxylase family protein [Acetobacteraceae bacterium]